MQDIVESFQPHAQKLGIRLTILSEHKNIQVWFDTQMLDKVFFNLIANALKFCGEKGHVGIRIAKDNDQVTIEVEDNGIGISADDINKIFDQFYQVDHAPSMGSGIGLSLSRDITRLHYGKLGVNSEKWKGTTFKVILPLGDSHLRADEKTISPTLPVNLIERSKAYVEELNQITVSDNQDAFRLPKEFTVLLVEDNADLLQYLKDKISHHFDVYTASNGRAALNEAFDRVPDLIISDVVLPELSGKDLCENLKSDFRTSHIPIILLTAQNSIEQQISGINARADLYITKPFNFDFLLASINNLIKNRVKLKEHFNSDAYATEKIPLSKSLDKKFINDFMGIVEQNLANDKFNVDNICKLIGVSRVQVYRKVKALLGCSISDYILDRRLKKAKYLLNHEDQSIAEVTYMVGFSNPNYFSTVFKSKYGCTPSEFKKQRQV